MFVPACFVARPIPRPRDGFTLIELMVGSLIGSLLVGGLTMGFINQRRTLKVQEQIGVMQQNTRSAMDLLARDVAMAGYGLRVSDYWLPQWIDWESELITNPTVIEGSGGAPDALLIAAAFDPPFTSLSAASTAGSSTLHLATDVSAIVNNTDQSVIFLGRSETVRVLSIAGSSVTVSTHPTESKGLRYAYPAGAPLELVKVRRYTLENHPTQYPFSPYLARTDTGEVNTHAWTKMMAGDIEDLQLVADGYSVLIDITGRVAHPDSRYRDPDRLDGYRRLTLSRRAFPRNQPSR